ncbi:MAG: glycosyltransferase family 2 protein [Phycisphaeraceae bacterium]
MQLSVIIPVYNEAATIEKIVSAVQAVDIPKEIIIVDDGSTDLTPRALAQLSKQHENLRIFTHHVNQGKGAALRRGIAEAVGDIVLVQDADLEYDPREYPRLIAPIVEDRADVVYGSRFLTGPERRVLYFWHATGNRLLTLISNMFTDLKLTDMETCYKVFRRDVIQKITLEENGFGFEPEVTAKVAWLRCRVYEVGISYTARTYAEGKKINWRDGFEAIWCIFKYNVIRRGS